MRRLRMTHRPSVRSQVTASPEGEIRVMEARREMRRFQATFGPRITPALALLYSDQWNTALAIDPDGHGLRFLIQSWREQMVEY